MLMAHPTVLRNLLERYETLRAEAGDGSGVAEAADPITQQQLQDTMYTLCVSTGTREIGAALAAARRHVESFNADVFSSASATIDANAA